MKTLLLLLCNLLGDAYAERPRLDMVIKDEPMVSVSLLPDKTTCCLPEPIKSLESFKQQIIAERLGGPCYFQMTRIYRASVIDYFFKTWQWPDAYQFEYLTILVDIQAPKEFQTYIDRIHFEQDVPGANCASLRFSRWISEQMEEEPRYFKDIVSDDDNKAMWSFEGHQQIEGGNYLIEIPRGCLTDATNLVITTTYAYENAASQFKVLWGQDEGSEIFGALTVSKNATQLNTNGEGNTLVQSQREYEWVVPATHITFKDGAMTIMAQIAIDEAMLADYRRDITKLSLVGVCGAGCAETALYARKKGTGRGVPELRVENLRFDGHGLHVEAPWSFSAPIYDFRFVLPSDCRVKYPKLRVTVNDHKDAESSAEVGDEQSESSEEVGDNQNEDVTTKDVTTKDVATQEVPIDAGEIFTGEVDSDFLAWFKKEPGRHFNLPKEEIKEFWWDGSHIRVLDILKLGLHREYNKLYRAYN